MPVGARSPSEYRTTKPKVALPAGTSILPPPVILPGVLGYGVGVLVGVLVAVAVAVLVAV